MMLQLLHTGRFSNLVGTAGISRNGALITREPNIIDNRYLRGMDKQEQLTTMPIFPTFNGGKCIAMIKWALSESLGLFRKIKTAASEVHGKIITKVRGTRNITPFSISLLPPELVANIVGRLDNKTAVSCSRLNKRMNEICRGYRLNRPVAEEVHLSYDKEDEKLSLNFVYCLSPGEELQYMSASISLQQYGAEDKMQLDVLQFSFYWVRCAKKLTLENFVVDTQLVDLVCSLKREHRGLECLCLRDSPCSVGIDAFYDLVNAVDLLDTDMETLSTVQKGDTTYDEFLSNILPSLNLYADAEDIAFPKYTMDTLTDAFLPRLLEVMPKEFILADCETNFSLKGIEHAFNACLTYVVEFEKNVYWNFGCLYLRKLRDRGEFDAMLTRIPNNRILTRGHWNALPWLARSTIDETKIEINYTSH